MTPWQLYQNVVFISYQPFATMSSFAIISAINPAGKMAPAGQNLCRHMAFAASLHDARVRYRKVTGASTDCKHLEPSWAVFCSRYQAVQYALDWQQNALYWVEDDELWLLPALLQQEPVALGCFSQRLILAS
ncbi:DUF3293 domain-containing protein [Alkalimonas amylolytica]|uniref:DUF3293 domain-containing protein n=1 Tax=Alkalimonas amylolytica TaxID=152573 RepID=A0A1H3WXZ4_ALKAM|nr:DUF3293 domain-containing protein [Alkalimonas amylolytica]SDZ91983.1 Protein of unknown function [Alkalimonas amylolytica]